MQIMNVYSISGNVHSGQDGQGSHAGELCKSLDYELVSWQVVLCGVPWSGMHGRDELVSVYIGFDGSSDASYGIYIGEM